ncbi:hypothetical protein [Streptomyces cinereospinus]|uniref:Resolvase/invertase-type recombinase catalytic domain-containing protein n=1 Tax=Streptomyces cinereospinus TaxID=285561 RepID=A0ABV5N2R6_9ACTN
MKRTPGDTSRRRVITDAASGFPSRATVVLYTCIAPGQDQTAVLTRLRRYAEARDWVVIGEVIDHTTTATPLDSRPNWQKARTLITSGQAHGIVTTSRTACAVTPTDLSLVDWLAQHQAFLAEAEPLVEGLAG